MSQNLTEIAEINPCIKSQNRILAYVLRIVSKLGDKIGSHFSVSFSFLLNYWKEYCSFSLRMNKDGFKL